MEKINIAELLKNCPEGMELDCTVYDECVLDSILENEQYPIKLRTPEGYMILSQYGCISLSKHAKCVIFPKGKTTWDGFIPLCKFKDGDILADANGNIAIYKGMILYNKKLAYYYYCGYRRVDNAFIVKNDKDSYFGHIEDYHYATEEEKQKLFDAIKDNGYKWNEEKKVLEKLPRFKVGNEIVKKNSISNSYIVSSVSCDYYGLILPNNTGVGVLNVSEQDEWELVSNKFDITTLKPFDKVLVRGDVGQKWTHDFFGFMDKDKGYPFVCVGHYVIQCIPYEGNEHLLGTTNDCDDFYKTW